VCSYPKHNFALHTVKKVHEFPVSSRDVTNQTPPGQEKFSYDVIIPAQGEFGTGSDIPAVNGKLANLFFTVQEYQDSLPCQQTQNFMLISNSFFVFKTWF
jgi:hypothetical protein